MSVQKQIDLSRSSQRWSEVANAGGFALRYTDALLAWIRETAKEPQDSQEILAFVLNHLAQKGFGENAKGRLADHLLNIVVRITKAFYRKIREDSEFQIEQVAVDDPRCVEPWCANLLVRAWRALERAEHAAPKLPLYTILQQSTQHPDESDEQFVNRLYAEHGLRLATDDVPRAINGARRKFAQLLADEVAETLMQPTDKDTLAELARLELDELVAPYVHQDKPA